MLACPPAEIDCSRGCTDYLFASHGIRNCEVNTTGADIGTTFLLPFVIVLPTGAKAEAVREVIVESPCSRDNANYCDGVCVPVGIGLSLQSKSRLFPEHLRYKLK